MTEEEKEEIDQEIRAAYTSGYADGFEVGKKKERELQCGKNHLENLAKENEELKAQIKKLKVCQTCEFEYPLDSERCYYCNDHESWELKK